ncbi:babA [Helicobacter pylori NQ4228]|nr:babA [Helicobacter pylori NQ4228]
MKKHILSFALGSLLVSTLSAEDDGFYTSVGYQIGEAAQMVSNTKGIQQLSDNYENLSKLLTRYSKLNTFIQLASDPSNAGVMVMKKAPLQPPSSTTSQGIDPLPSLVGITIWELEKKVL